MYKRAIEIINDTSGLEPYLDAFIVIIITQKMHMKV